MFQYNLCSHLSAQIVCVVPKTVEFAIGPTDGRYNYMETITYSCILGYEIQSGDLERTCQADGTWCGIPPVCGMYFLLKFKLAIDYISVDFIQCKTNKYTTFLIQIH